MVFRMGVLMMDRLCSFLGFWFGRLRSPPAPDPDAAQPHVSCENIRISAVVFVTLSVMLAPAVRDNTTSYVRCVIPMSMRGSTVPEHRTSLSQMLNMADPNPTVTLIHSFISPAP
ncbi:hypothetical protein PBY51_001613 [Eleginops maclovinus]|nr:hypothetical protein PBY51_001613 [Eleginops maclovinus]